LSGMQSTGISVTALTELEQFDRCVALQDIVWGYEPSDMMGQKVFLLASRIGGQVLGAFDGETLVGYAMSLPGVRNGHAYLHSHHLAVLPEWRNAGIGKRLKLAQRGDALARGIELMEWTFDPLQIKNAHLNISRLGAIVRRYSRNFYGPSSSPLQGGLPTDRVYAEWWLRSERVRRVLAGEATQIRVEERVEVPVEVDAWKAEETERGKALALQASNAAALESAFARGQAVLGYERNERGDGAYLLGRWDEQHYY
jgi:predicted GNAT superfamily acetyltransferase